ncbi:transposase, partial [Phocaeicola vulgatus]
MKKDEIIELLKEQIKELRDDNNRLLGQIDDLIKEVSSLKEALLQKGESLSKQQRLAKGLAKFVSNTSEQQQAPQPAMSEEERQKREAEKADKRKARKNNGAKRDMHYEMEQEEHDVYPNDPDFDINKARLVTTAPRICVRYECVPIRFIKHVYKIHTYAQDGRFFEGKTPVSAFLNSSYDGSFIAGLMELRYIQSLPVERIINYFESHGFTLKKPTAHKLMEKASSLFENLYKCIRQTALSDPYKA